MRYMILTVLLLATSLNTQAAVYFEMGAEGGGDTLIGSSSGEELNAGGGIKLALGVQNRVGADNAATLSISLGYLFDSIDASNGTADINAYPLDLIYSMRSNAHRFGIGASYHMNPEYKDNIAGFSPLTVNFDDALGFLFQYGYSFGGLQVGFRVTNMDYEANGSSIDANSVGFFLSNGF